MNFSILSDCHKKWQDILVIGKTIERDGKKYHILGRTVFTGTVSAGKNHMHDALEQSCPKGMCYIGIEYECSKNYDLVFHSKQYLKSRPETRQGSAHFLMMRLKPDQEIGTHVLPLFQC